MPAPLRLLVVALVVAACASPAAAQSVHREVLPSGLVLVVAEYHSTPAVEVRVAVRASPLNEGPLLGSGASVLLQRLLVASGNGAQSGEEVARAIARLGNRFHAETTVASAAYTVSTTGDKVPDALGVLAGMLGNYQYTQVDLQRERQALIAQSVPEGETLEGLLLASLLYRQHPARLPVTGTPRMMDQLTLDLMRRYQAARYTAPNTVVTVVGNVNSTEVRRWVEQAFAQYSVGGYQPTAPYAEPPQYGPRYASAATALAQPRVAIAWRTEPLEHPNQAPLRVLARLLEAAVLPRAVAARGLKSELRVVARQPVDQPGALVVSFAAAAETRGDVERAVYEAIEALIKDGPSPDDLAGAKRALLLADAVRHAGVGGIAEDLERWELATGDPAYGRVHADQLRAVAAEDVVRVARRYCGEGAARACTVVLRPGGEPVATGGAPADPTGSVAPEVVDLGRGLRLLLRPAQEAPLVHLRLTLGGGAGAEEAEPPGSAAMLADLLARGAGARRPDEFRAALARAGLEPVPSCDQRALGIDLACLPDDLDAALTVVADLLTRPTLPADDLEAVRAQALRRLDAREGDRRLRLLAALRATALAGHPAARDPAGTRESVARLDRAALVALHRRLALTGNAVIALYGRFDRAAAASTLARLLAERPTLPEGAAVLPAPTETAAPAAPLNVVYHDGVGAGIAVAWPGPSLADRARDEAAMAVLGALLAGGDVPGGRINRVLAAGTVVPVREAYHGRGLFALVGEADATAIDAVQQAVREQVAALRAQLELPGDDPKALGEVELATARAVCLTAQALRDERHADVAGRQAVAVLAGLPLALETDAAARIAAVGVADLRRVAARWLAAEPVVVVDRPRRAEEARIAPPAPEPAPAPVPAVPTP